MSRLAQQVKRYLRLAALAKKRYDQADELLAKIGPKWEKSGEILEIDGVKYEIFNEFEGKLKVWGHGSVRRWSIEPVKKGKLAA